MPGALGGDVNIPHVGKLPKIAVVGGVGVVIVLVIRHYQQQAAAASSAAAAVPPGGVPGDPYPSDGTTGNPDDPYSLDPSTGVTYGDEAASGLGAGYGGYDTGLGVAGVGGGAVGVGGGYGISSATDPYPWDGTYSVTSDPYSMNPATGQTYGDSGSTGSSAGVTTGTSGPPFSTNAQWSQYVLSYFTTNGFADLAGMQTAIGAYLAGTGVNATQQGYINDAIAIANDPPVAGTGNYPPNIRLTGSSATGTGSTATSPTGSSSGSAVATLSGGHIVAGTLKPTDVTIAWDSTVATSWQVTTSGPAPLGGRTGVVTSKQASYSGMSPGHHYEFRVQGLVGGKPSGKSGNIDVDTPAK